MPQVKVNTKWKAITKNISGLIPKAHSFVFRNTGTCTVFINNLPLMPGEYIGDDSSHLVAEQIKNPALKFERAESYEIAFANHTNTGYDADAAAQVVGKRKTLFLVETFYTIQP